MRIAAIAGGRTAEAEGTVGSARLIATTAASLGYEVVIIYLDATANPQARIAALAEAADHDVVIPLISGLEGALALLDVAFVGSTPAAAGIAAHKGLFNDLVAASGFGKVPYIYGSVSDVMDQWGTSGLQLPVFVKPARLGASYGIARVESACMLKDAVVAASIHDSIIVVEQSVPGPFSEFEVPIIAGRTTVVGTPGRVQLPSTALWHDTASKYSLETKISRADDEELENRLMYLAVASASLVGVTCATRVDLFVDHRGEIYVGEINALPGHGVASTFPRIFEMAGFSRARQLDLMIEAAVFQREKSGRGAYVF